MGLYSKIRLFSECFKIAGTAGLIACAKYLLGCNLFFGYLNSKPLLVWEWFALHERNYGCCFS